MKKSFFMLIILFVSGIVSADVCVKILKDSDVLVNLQMYAEYANAELVFQDVLWNILYERLKLFFLLAILVFVPIRQGVVAILFGMFSYIWGFFIMSSVLGLGIAGIVVGIAAVLPHGLLYVGVIGLLFRRKRIHSYHTKEKITLYVTSGLFGLLLFVTGCVVESLVSTHFIPWVIRLSLI